MSNNNGNIYRKVVLLMKLIVKDAHNSLNTLVEK